MDPAERKKLGYALEYLQMLAVDEREEYYVDWVPKEFEKCTRDKLDCWSDWVSDFIDALRDGKDLKLPWE